MRSIQEAQEMLAQNKEHYADLLILQYHDKPKARETIKMGLGLFTGDGMLYQLYNILDIDTAVGEQLDIIGKIVGCPRNIQGLDVTKKYFSFEEATIPYGFSTRSVLSEGDFKTRYNSTLSVYSLLDEDYRALLKFKAAANVVRGSMAGIDEIYWNLFGNDIKMINNMDLSVTYKINSNLLVSVAAAIQLGYIKAPLGIKYDYEYVTM